MSDTRPDSDTLLQLDQLGYLEDGSGETTDRPLLICDVDEVVLHLVDPFEQVLRERGFELKSHSFKLTGNIFHVESGREASREEVWEGLTQLFEEQAERQGLVEGVVDGLNHVAEHADVLFLTNMPHMFRDTRIAHLLENGLDHPLVTNTGSKMPAIGIVRRHRHGAIGFIDDTPGNLDHVRAGAPDVHLFHFMANANFRALAGDIEGAHFSSGDWADTAPRIRQVLMETVRQ